MNSTIVVFFFDKRQPVLVNIEGSPEVAVYRAIKHKDAEVVMGFVGNKRVITIINARSA
jgi:hypothetical protein